MSTTHALVLAAITAAWPMSTSAQQPASPPFGASPTQDAQSLIEQAREAARTDRNARSATLFAQAIALAPQRRLEWLREYADQLTYSGAAAQAVPLYEELLAQPQPPAQRQSTRKGLGLALLWSDRADRAVPVYQAVLQQEPGDQDARRNLGRAFSWSGQQRLAIAHYQALLRDHPQDHDARRQLAQAQAWLGRPDQAAQSLAGEAAAHADARRLREELARAQAPRTVLDAQASSQSNDLAIRSLRARQAWSFADGLGTLGLRLERIDYQRGDDTDSARVTQPTVHGRYRFGDALEFNAELGQQHIAPRGAATMDRSVHAAWLTWWPSDLLRVDLSSNRGSFDNLQSLRMGLTWRQRAVSVDLTPSQLLRYHLQLEQADISDGNRRSGGQFEAQYRWRTHPEAWVGLRHTRFEFDQLLNNGYFNPLRFEATHVTLRAQWQLDGPQGRWDAAAAAALGREHAVPEGSKPAYDLSLRAGWRPDAHSRFEARAQRFSSRTAASGFARTSIGLAFERTW